jgi:hypothetical protein
MWTRIAGFEICCAKKGKTAQLKFGFFFGYLLGFIGEKLLRLFSSISQYFPLWQGILMRLVVP